MICPRALALVLCALPLCLVQAQPTPAPPPKAVNKPTFMIKKDKLSGDLPHLPDVIKAQRRGSTVLGTYKMCIDTSGRVQNVTPVSSIPGADDFIMGTLRTWVFKPQPIPVCFTDAFQFVIEGPPEGAPPGAPQQAPAPPAAPKAPAPPKDPEPEPTLDGMMKALGPAFERQMGQHQALRLYCGFLAARARFGRAAVFSAGEVETINIAISRAQQKAGREAASFTKLITDHFPQLLIANDGNLWHWSGGRYALDFPALTWDVDEERGTLYAVNMERQMLWFDPKLGRFRPNGIDKVRDLQVTDGVVYYLTTDGALMVRLRGQSSRVLPRTLDQGGSLYASRSVLYLIEGGALFRYAGNTWDKGGAAIQRNVQQVAADGKDYYALDQAGHVYAGPEARYIEKDTSFTGIWLIGKNLLALSRSGRVMGYAADKHAWQVFRE